MSTVPRRGPLWWWAALVIGLVGLGAVVWFLWTRALPYDAPPKSFDGPSDKLQHTVIVPTLDTPIPDGKSAIWCSSFQVAWNRLKDDVVKEPIHIEGAEEIADRLNTAEQSEADLESDSFYAAAGFSKDGIIERIQREMAARFPNVPMPKFQSRDIAVTYAYLAAGVKYRHPYSEANSPFAFKDSKDHEHLVHSFGTSRAKIGKDPVREQIEVLFVAKEFGREWVPEEFALDLDKNSVPNQVVLAQVPRRETLSKTLADLQKKMTDSRPDEHDRRFGSGHTLAVPTMHWRIEHHFRELEDRPLLKGPLQGYPLETLQIIHFRLDRSGATVESESRGTVKSVPREFHFDRPFLIYLKKRDAQHPFFVMWVDNAELLQTIESPKATLETKPHPG